MIDIKNIRLNVITIKCYGTFSHDCGSIFSNNMTECEKYNRINKLIRNHTFRTRIMFTLTGNHLMKKKRF